MSKNLICKEVGISRSALYWKPQKKERKRYSKAEDKNIVDEIQAVVKLRPTYGYKRVTAMINKDRAKNGLTRVNRKRIYRVMDINGLIFKKEVQKKDHEPTGKIITLHSNTRWCSDGFEIHCYNGEKSLCCFLP